MALDVVLSKDLKHSARLTEWRCWWTDGALIGHVTDQLFAQHADNLHLDYLRQHADIIPSHWYKCQHKPPLQLPAPLTIVSCFKTFP